MHLIVTNLSIFVKLILKDKIENNYRFDFQVSEF